MKTIQLTLGHSTTVDDSDYDELMKYKWCFSRVKGHSVGYATRSVQVNGKKKTIMMHRHIMGLGFDRSIEVDHRDGYGLNNQRYNLRSCSHIENQRNRAVNKSNLLGIKGISQPTTKRGYFVRITVMYKSIYLGYFQDLEDAKKARLDAELKYFGDYIRKKENNIG